MREGRCESEQTMSHVPSGDSAGLPRQASVGGGRGGPEGLGTFGGRVSVVLRGPKW